MMTTYFISTVRYDKTMENGLIKPVNEQYLIDALSFTEAEARTIEELQPYMSGEFTIPQIVKPRISELMLTETEAADRYYKARLRLSRLTRRQEQRRKPTVSFSYRLPISRTLTTALPTE